MATTKWNIDPSHSEIQFKVKHMMITNVTGQFNQYRASMESSREDFNDSVISFEADVNSITTYNEQRDGHIKSDDFFNAEKFPLVKFSSKKKKKTGDDKYELTGNITIRDIIKEIKLIAEYGGTMTDPYGQVKAGFELSGKINRKDFNLKWNAVTETGGIVLADEVKLHLAVQMVKQA